MQSGFYKQSGSGAPVGSQHYAFIWHVSQAGHITQSIYLCILWPQAKKTDPKIKNSLTWTHSPCPSDQPLSFETIWWITQIWLYTCITGIYF